MYCEKIEYIKDNKKHIRLRKQRNLIAKNNKYRGGFHTPSNFELGRRYRLESDPISQEEINDWWEHNL